ncbi:Disease resistance RPP13-like protein 4 [Heracleum sosnowskyi]|uniref:Disease resistance RPP13-like protein 4 n=1 Tax=Heracleum sosnowskyi TaxID=360622 RepID=A0AAD8IWX7_9APIA|nr:Disease resistance RPP13-like protein 4 [Heracleum sosnowskyi]
MSSSDPTTYQPAKSSSDEPATSKVEEDKQTQVIDDDANKSISQDAPHSITPDPKHQDADKKEVANAGIDNRSDQTKVVEAPQQSGESIPEEKDEKQTRLVGLPQQSDDIAPGEDDKQTKLVDADANKSVSTKQADEITADTNQEDGDGCADQNEQNQVDAGESGNSLSNKSGPVTDDALILLVQRELEYINETARFLEDYGDICHQSLQGSKDKIAELNVSLTDALNDTVSDEVGQEKRIRDAHKEIRIFKKHLRKLKLIIPPKFKVNKDDIPELRKYLSESTQNVKLYTSDNKQILGKLDLFKEKLNHEYRSAFKDFQLRYDELDCRMKLCLLCFSAIPEHEVIKKRLMVYWWIGEGFIIPENSEEKKQDLEQLGAKTFDDLLEKHFIYSADRKDIQEVDNCRMLPFVRWAVIYLAQRAKFFEFDHDGVPTEDYSSCFRACLSGNGLDTQKAPDLEKLHMLLNVNEPILELKPEWLLKMRNTSILCLGRWQAAPEHHIEVEDTKFLQGLKNMIHLRYLSLQGISRITELPNSVSCLTKLTMLDLRACHNLEIIPRDIGLLKMLTYLDLSECYLLTQMPRGLAKLGNLVVLKGFLVVEDPKKEKICTLEDLTKLKKLRKLSIFTGVEAFPGSKDLIAFRNFEVLDKLKIVWGGMKAIKGQLVTGETKVEGGATKGVSNVEISKEIPRKLNVIAKSKKSSRKPVAELDSSKLGLPQKLQKLDLQCYPLESAPDWLKPKKLEELKKLYIRGGKLRDLNLTNDNWEVEPWNVETLRLKYLTGLGMNWTELLELFPKLVYLEKVRCTKLTLFPCNDKGVWINKEKLPKKLLASLPLYPS